MKKSKRKGRFLSLVLWNVDTNATVRVANDFECLKSNFNYFAIECALVTWYRMERPNSAYPRLMKVVLPSSFLDVLF